MNLGSQMIITLDEIWGRKNFWVRKMQVQKMLRSKKYFDPKQFGTKNSLSPKQIQGKENCVPKNFGSKRKF